MVGVLGGEIISIWKVIMLLELQRST